MKKDKFIECMNAYKGFSDFLDNLHNYDVDIFQNENVSNFIERYLDLLSICCNDPPIKADGFNETNIEYFIYELKFGKNADNLKIIEDGKEISLFTVEDLWNYLVKNHPEINDENT